MLFKKKKKKAQSPPYKSKLSSVHPVCFPLSQRLLRIKICPYHRPALLTFDICTPWSPQPRGNSDSQRGWGPTARTDSAGVPLLGLFAGADVWPKGVPLGSDPRSTLAAPSPLISLCLSWLRNWPGPLAAEPWCLTCTRAGTRREGGYSVGTPSRSLSGRQSAPGSICCGELHSPPTI